MDPDFIEFTNAWFSVGIAAVTAAFLFAALAYAVGTGFNLGKLRQWGKDEIYQAIGNLLLMGTIFLLFIPLLNTFLDSVAGPCPLQCSLWCGPLSNLTNPGDLAFAHLSCFFSTRGAELFGYLGLLSLFNLMLGIASSFSLSVAPFNIGISFVPFAGIAPITELATMLTTVGSVGVAFMSLQTVIFSFIKAKALIFLPLGIALRCLPFTRGAGAAVLALFFGLSFMYPLLFLFEAQMVGRDIFALQANIALSSIAIIGTSIAASNPLLSTVFGMYTPSLIMNTLKNFGVLISYYTFIVAMFLPVFNLSITFIFTRELSRTLGGDINLGALAKLI